MLGSLISVINLFLLKIHMWEQDGKKLKIIQNSICQTAAQLRPK